jgi:hypothetical protein
VLAILVSGMVPRNGMTQVPKRPPADAPNGVIIREYRWCDFAGVQRSCRFEIPRAELAASAAEFGADPEDMKAVEIRLEREITFTPEQVRDPKVMARIKQQVQAELDKQAQAALEARRKKLVARGLVLLGEDKVTVDLGQLWRWNLKRMQPQVRRFADATGSREPLPKAVLAFVQEIPYRKPPDQRAGRSTFGLLPPLEALAAGYGDCDTKSLLFAALADNGRGPEIILLRGPGHVVAGLECSAKEKGTRFRAFGKHFLICECSDGIWLPGEVSPDIRKDLEAKLYQPVRLRKST